MPSPLPEKEVPGYLSEGQAGADSAEQTHLTLPWPVARSLFSTSPFLHLLPFRTLSVTVRTINYNLVKEDVVWSKHPLSIIQHPLMRSDRSTFCSTSCHGISQEMALLIPTWPLQFPQWMWLKCKCAVYEYGETTSLPAGRSNELGAYFAMHLSQFNTKGLRGFARLKKTLKVLMGFGNEFSLVPKQYVEWHIICHSTYCIVLYCIVCHCIVWEKQFDIIVFMYELREYCIWAHL